MFFHRQHLAYKVRDVSNAKDDVQEDMLVVKIKQEGVLPPSRCGAFHFMNPFLVMC